MVKAVVREMGQVGWIQPYKTLLGGARGKEGAFVWQGVDDMLCLGENSLMLGGGRRASRLFLCTSSPFLSAYSWVEKAGFSVWEYDYAEDNPRGISRT